MAASLSATLIAGSAGILPAESAQRAGLKVKAEILSRCALIAGTMPALPAMAGNLIIRLAQKDEAARLSEIAHDAKRHWGYPEHWIQHWQDDLTITADYIAANRVYVAEGDGDLLGFYALIMRREKAELDHIWVLPSHIGTGVGKQLFLHAMQTAAGERVAEVEILSDPNAEGFYRKMGAHQTGEVVSEIDGQPRSLPRLTIDPKS